MIDFSHLVGVLYRKGGANLDGFDCYGLVRFVAREAVGTELPEKPIGWRRYGALLGKYASIKPFDILFFCMANDEGITDHVGIAVSEIEFLHASGPAQAVVQEPIRRYAHRIIDVGRLNDPGN